MRRAARGGLRTVATAAKCHRAPGRLPSGRGSNADRPFDELATSTARRIAAASRQRRHQPGREPVVIERVDSQVGEPESDLMHPLILPASDHAENLAITPAVP